MSTQIFDASSIKKIAEDSAYTFKGLHKTADWFDLSSKLYLTIPILFSIISLGFDSHLHPVILKILAVISMFTTSLVFINQNKYQLIEGYRKLANQYKELYDSLELAFNKKDSDYDIIKAKDCIAHLDQKTVKYPISKIGRIWSKKFINKEMNLSWLNQ